MPRILAGHDGVNGVALPELHVGAGEDIGSHDVQRDRRVLESLESTMLR